MTSKILNVVSALGGLFCLGLGLFAGGVQHDWARGTFFVTIGYGNLIGASLRRMKEVGR